MKKQNRERRIGTVERKTKTRTIAKEESAEREMDGLSFVFAQSGYRERERAGQKEGKERKGKEGTDERVREKEGSPIKKWELGGKQSNDNNNKKKTKEKGGRWRWDWIQTYASGMDGQKKMACAGLFGSLTLLAGARINL